ncbi:hypothetical protein QQF64_009156 [Cirrhinus molitorella]|uniref:Secreted protein n=1 Tax=Cirrhinus molitorella TaxID=172907 RepID=A0ABR3M3F6_9TELE
MLGVFPLRPGVHLLIYRDVSGALSLSGVCCTNATRMTAMRVCRLKCMRAQHKQLLGERDACTQRKDGTRFGGKQKIRAFSLVCMRRDASSRYGKPEGSKTFSGARVPLALKVTLLC